MKYRLEALADKPEDEGKLEQMLRAEDAFYALSRILNILSPLEDGHPTKAACLEVISHLDLTHLVK